MMIFTRISKASRPSSALALALVLAATGTAGVFALEQPAFAQKKKKEEKPAAKSYSKEFIAAYQPLADAVNAPAPDYATINAQLPAMKALIQSNDERMVAGNLIYNVGTKNQNRAQQLEGVELMLASGQVPAENQGQYNLLAGQLAYNEKEYAKTRTYLMKAVEFGYTEGEPQGLIAESFFAEDNHAAGLKYLAEAIAAEEAAGNPVNEQWVRRGLQMAYNNQMAEELGQFGLLFVKHFPSTQNWGEVIAITAYGGGWQNPEILDLVRLARSAKAMRDERMYADYIDSADYRRLPGEVVAVIDEGYAQGTLKKTDTYVAEVRGMAAERAKTDRADLAGLLSKAKASTDVKSIVTGGDLALSYGDYAAAEVLYTKALGMPGVDAGLARTRLGIAQLEQGKAAEAVATFNAVEGKRAAIARLWATYAAEEAGI
ncbi:hypothetical protein GRI42_04120 [Erythrobacter gaetbuli]|uniref:Tetratricopeptide repeat protein n=1 Tax=Qipengyuania gaetbuli TaxID=266952 RepID=A0A844Y009_9SPHN|nr:hypothetical protein [Qipengyuania gaetbuli]MXO50488.1 hypothetical protein [Qipengyuania gaetbuli]